MPRDRNPDCFHISASAISAFKACPTRFRLGYREGLRLADDSDAQRMGTNWHALHEVYNAAKRRYASEPDHWEACSANTSFPTPHDFGYHQAVEHLNDRYAEVPLSKTQEEWETERLVLITAFHVYLWYYEHDPIESLAEEVAFDLPMHEPRTGMPLPTTEVLRVGKIDTVVKWRGMVGNREMKSTGSAIDPDSKYWEKSQKDTQVSMYALAMHDLAASGQLPDSVRHGMAADANFGNTLYDVWRKPKSKPKGLTQKAAAEFITEAVFFGQDFAVDAEWDTATKVTNKGKKNEKTVAVKTLRSLMIDGVETTFEVGKSGGVSFRETPRMYAARLMHDMMENPHEYFARKEIARTDKDLARFRVELYRTYQAMRAFDQRGCWFENEHQCRATFTCSYIPVCYGAGADAVCQSGQTPPGFKRIFNVTVDGDAINDEAD